jgi:uncharacterized protein
VIGAPALVIEPSARRASRTLVVSDVHLGLASGPGRAAGPFEGSGRLLSDELLRIARRARADEILIAGDVKHPIVGTPPGLRPEIFDFFSRILSEGFSVDVVLGNHDVGLVPHLPREVSVQSAAGIVRHGVGIFHGHRWPSEEVLRAPRLVAGHLHPGYRFAPTPADPEGKRRCWVRVAITPQRSRGRSVRDRRRPRATELVVLPAFNPIAGTESLNRDRPARGRTFLYGRFLSLGDARAYLLDGTDLGPLFIRRPDVPSS